MDMTPRKLRDALERGEMQVTEPRMWTNPPKMPQEWGRPRRNRMLYAVKAALMFLKGSRWYTIARMMEKNKMLHKKREVRGGELISRARVQQYIAKGLKFLEQRGAFEVVDGPKASTKKKGKK